MDDGSKAKIVQVHARQLLDCKCRPMVEVDIVTQNGSAGTGAAPTGSSVGEHESFVLRDGDLSEYDGMSVHKAVKNVNEIIAPALIGQDVRNQEEIDRIMIDLDGTPDKHSLGGNAIYSVSVAAYRAAAAYMRQPLYEMIAGDKIRTLPIPSFNIMNGGNNNGIIQTVNEFIVMPWRAQGIEQAVEIGVKVFKELGKVIEKRTGKNAGVGGSYGWTAPSEDPRVCLDLIQEAIDCCGYTDQCAFALDCAASEMYDGKSKTYYLNGQRYSSEELIDYYRKLTKDYRFIFIEDMLSEDDWEGFRKAHKEIKNTLIIADDFTVSNRERIERAVKTNSIDGFILKPNQVGTISEALNAQKFASEHGVLSITSGRSGGVIGDVVMDLAVGLKVPFIKNGCPRSGERIDKLNYLLRIKDMYPDCDMMKIDDLVKF